MLRRKSNVIIYFLILMKIIEKINNMIIDSWPQEVSNELEFGKDIKD